MAGRKVKNLIVKSAVAVRRKFNHFAAWAFSSKFNAKIRKAYHKGSMEYAPLITRNSSKETEDYEKDVSITTVNLPEITTVKLPETTTVNLLETTEEVQKIIEWTACGPEDKLTISNFGRISKEPFIRTTTCHRPNEKILISEKGQGNIIIYNKILGKGGFGTVHKGLMQNKDNISEIAVKAINYEEYIRTLPLSMACEWETGFRRLLNNELKAMLLCEGHQNIVQVKFVTITDSEVLCGLEYAAKGDLLEYIAANGRLPERRARKWYKDLAEAVVYCHSKGIVHLDIKAENVLVDDNDNVKLTDFGLALIATHPQDPGEYKLVGSCRGTLAYMAPEMLARNVEDTRLCDAWNLAIVLFNMLAGFTDPFWEKGNEIHRFSQFQSIPAEAKTLVREALEVNPSKRLSLEAMLKHPWLQGE